MKEISAGDIVSTALSINGEVIAWGPQSDEMPVVSPELKGSVQIIAGEEPDRISALKDGTVWLWSYFKEAPPTNIPDLQDINQISTAFHIITVLKKDGTVWIWHEYEGSFLNNQVPDLHGVVKIAAGDFFGLALKDDGTVWTWSHGDKSEPSYPIQVPNLEHIKDIAIGEAHCLALKSDGTVWTWGWNEMGQLGNGKNTQNQDIPVQVNNLHDVKEIAAGYAHSLAVTTDGEVWAWGWNKYGQLGDGTNGDKNTPTKINWSVIK
jgi:alpha-tubulin suppressor-like RCC1 family protein